MKTKRNMLWCLLWGLFCFYLGFSYRGDSVVAPEPQAETIQQFEQRLDNAAEEILNELPPPQPRT